MNVEEKIQSSGACIRDGARTHCLVLQLVDVVRAEQRWEGRRRNGPMHAGSIALLPAGMRTAWEWAGATNSLHIYFSPGDVEGLREAFCVRDPYLSLLSRRLQFFSNLRHDALRKEAVFFMLARHLLRMYSSSASPASQSALTASGAAMLADYIDAHHAESITLSELAELASVNKFWLAKLFKRRFGTSPYEYVVQRRVDHALELMQRSQMSLAGIAIACGFADQAHFNRHFTKMLGITPAEARRRLAPARARFAKIVQDVGGRATA